MTLIKPMLAASLLSPEDEHTDEVIFKAMRKLKKWPVMVTLKKDGIRGLVTNTLVSRRLKLIPNDALRVRARNVLWEGADVELWNPSLDYNEIESIVMSDTHPCTDLIQFHILDDWKRKVSYEVIIHDMDTTYISAMSDAIRFEFPTLCHDAEGLFTFFKNTEQELGEGICFRTLDSPYKQGRSTLREQYLIKLSRYVYSECIIIGFEEQYENTNRIKRDATGRIDRASCKDNLIGKDTLGALYVKDLDGLEFRVGNGVGWTDSWRKLVWNREEDYFGKMIKVKSKAHGKLIKPRSPVMVGFRKEIDI